MSGHRHLFIPGPTNVPQQVRLAMDIAQEDQRSPDFPGFVLPLLQDLKRVFKTTGGTAFVFPGTGTLGWEAALANTLSPGDRVLAARFGQFSHLWIEMCRRHGLEVDVIDAEWGEGIPVEAVAQHLSADRERRIKAVLACHNETATGVASDIAGVRKALDAAGHPALLLVDGVSSIGSIDFRMDEWGVDVAVTGSQKGLMLPAGLAVVAVSPKALARREDAKLARSYYDFAEMQRANKDGHFPYTPATTLLRGLRASLDLLFAEGLDNVFARPHRLAEGVRRAVAAWGLKLCARQPKWYSDTVSAVVVPEGFDSVDVVKLAYARYSLSFGIGLSKVAGKVFRIAHLGDLNELMLIAALAGAEMTLRDLGVPVDAGSGVAAAEEFWRKTARPVELGKRQVA
jgi:alanine-glyoxylate transaminase/serine-glyoxylate transaminase/serine-pyruvate transaminase